MFVPFHTSITHALAAVAVGWEESHLVNTGAVNVKLQSTGLELWPGVCLGGTQAMSMSDHTLDVLLNHLRDLDLPTILARLADRSEP